MPNILEDLYYGNISPSERRIRPGSKIQKAMQKRNALETKLNDSFTDEQKATFEQYLAISAEVLDSCCLDSFITGFRLGARFAHEVFVETNAPFAELTMDET